METEWVELKPSCGLDGSTDSEIERLIRSAKEKTKESTSLSDLSEGEEATGSSRLRRRGDGSAPMHCQHSPDRNQPSPCRETVTHENDDDLDDRRQHDHGSNDTARDEESDACQVRDRPPALQDDEEEEEDPTHAMICIGGRVDKNKKLFLLLQNSWARMPLVEVSIDYFIAAGATLTTVSRSEHSKFKKFAKADCLYAVNKTFVADCSRNKY